MKYVLYNNKSHNSNNVELVDNYINKLEGDTKKLTVFEIADYDRFLSELTSNDEVHLLGGDGTLNHFINIVKDKELPCPFYFSGCGTGNDFLNDVKEEVRDGRVLINELIKNLPVVTVNDKEYLFINGVGFGIDGYCCEKADELQAKSDKPVNYTSIAIKGLLFHYKAVNATVTVDGISKKYHKVYLAPTMKGRYYGGGMIVAPSQNRKDPELKVTSVVLYGKGRLKTLMVFPTIFKGEHILHKDMVDVISGNEIEVEFDRPTALQIDGEAISGVYKYKVSTKRN